MEKNIDKDIDMDKEIEVNPIGNVLVIGNSGVGKSTLINAVLGKEVVPTGWGTAGTTSKLEIYEREDLPFRIIDSIGFEPSYIKERRAINAVRKWSKDSAKEKGEKQPIDVIWFCIDGTSSKLFPQTIKNLSRATAMWESTPVIVVITKSYSEPDRPKNIELVTRAFAQQKRYSKNLRKVIPVVAKNYVINETAIAPPFGIDELIDATNEVMPEGIKAAETAISAFKLKRKRGLAQGTIVACVGLGATVGAASLPIADGLILSPLELAEVNALAAIYGINKGDNAKRLINSIVEVGTVSAAARTLISVLKAAPGINIAAAVLNAVIAGVIVAALGEGATLAFEKIYKGEKSIDDIDWVKKIIESKFAGGIIEKINTAFSNGTITDKTSKNDVGKKLLEILFPRKTDLK